MKNFSAICSCCNVCEAICESKEDAHRAARSVGWVAAPLPRGSGHLYVCKSCVLGQLADSAKEQLECDY